ncbi:MAG: Crp/Fnr family transcriptional regulator [Rudaea sp.]
MRRAENGLVAMLPRPDRLRFLEHCEPVELTSTQVLSERGDATRHAYFPVDAFISQETQIDEHSSIEVGLVGREGMFGIELAFGGTFAPARAMTQGAGSSWRVGAAALKRELSTSAPLRYFLNQYVCVRIAQTMRTSACTRFHVIDARLARWLLMSQDRAHTDHFRITHEVLARLLGVRRVGISVAAAILQNNGYIKYSRGDLAVTDRAGLERIACSCYASDLNIYNGYFKHGRIRNGEP